MTNFNNSTSSTNSINDVLAGTSSYYVLMICLSASIVFIIATMVFHCIIAKAYKQFYQKNVEVWKKLPEFPIFSHANYIHENVYASYQNVLLISILTFIFWAIHLFPKIFSSVLLAVLTVILVILLYILLIFGQVHLVLIAMVVWDDFMKSKEILTDYEIAKKQIEKKILIKWLYRTFLTRDLVLTPALVFFGWPRENFFQIFMLSIHNTIYAMVPFVTILYFVNEIRNYTEIKYEPRIPWNPLQTRIFWQIVVITVIQMIFFTFCGFLNFFKLAPIKVDGIVVGTWSSLTYVPHLILLILPLISQFTTCMERNLKPAQVEIIS